MASNYSNRAGLLAALVLLPVGKLYSSEFTCEATCTSDPGKCLEVGELEDDDTKAKIPEGLQKIYDYLSDPAVTAITNADLLAAFGLKTDPCNRSDTSISTYPPSSPDVGISNTHRAWNVGGRCRISAKITLPSGSEMQAGFLFGEILSIDYTVNEDNILLWPSITESPPLLYFSKPAFTKDFGGHIEFLQFGEDQSYIQTNSGCIWVTP